MEGRGWKAEGKRAEPKQGQQEQELAAGVSH
jgi:hypothetical protein